MANGTGSKWIQPAKRLAIYHRDGHCCMYCGAGAESGAPLSLDHVVARELGGSNDAKNLVTSCIGCNSSKQDLSLRAWIKALKARGVETAKLAARIRRQTARSLDMAEGRRLLAIRVELRAAGAEDAAA